MSRTGKISIVLFCLACCASAGIALHVLRSHRPAPTPQVLYQVVSNQFDALRRHDYTRAYYQTSQGMRFRFDLPEYERYAQSHYYPIQRAARLEIGAIQIHGNRARLRGYLVSPSQRVTPCAYSLVREEGEWKVSGVELLPSWPATVRLRGYRA